jgi:hypothetical protein
MEVLGYFSSSKHVALLFVGACVVAVQLIGALFDGVLPFPSGHLPSGPSLTNRTEATVPSVFREAAIRQAFCELTLCVGTCNVSAGQS